MVIKNQWRIGDYIFYEIIIIIYINLFAQINWYMKESMYVSTLQQAIF